MTKLKTLAKKGTRQIVHEKILMLRSVTYAYRSKRVIVWYAGDGTAFLGRCCHMKCMKYAREASGIREGRGL
jgi:hypothetical protein